MLVYRGFELWKSIDESLKPLIDSRSKKNTTKVELILTHERKHNVHIIIIKLKQNLSKCVVSVQHCTKDILNVGTTLIMFQN